MSSKKEDIKHIPVLLDEVLQHLAPQAGESYLDLTAGYGGHACSILGRTLNNKQASLVDRDQNAVSHLSQMPDLKDVQIIHQDFLHASQDLLNAGRSYDMILADLGVSSPHLDDGGRGFSIRENGPLDMRMDISQELTAKAIVNKYSEVQLVKLLQDYGEEPKARRIARAIIGHRPITSTRELAEVVRVAAWVSGGMPRTHPATKTFQALRLVVNDELSLLESALPYWLRLLAPGGRIVIISFHSLEDRLVKRFFQSVAGSRYDATLTLLTKKPVTASAHELVSNPRSRSAKLRAAAKINTKGRRS